MNVSISKLVESFDSGEIRLPLMQRDYVWKRPKVIRLLDSLYKRWPIGAFYVWRTSDDYPLKDREGRLIAKTIDGFYGFLLDGQQRLTSLSLAVRTPADGDLEHRAFFDLENQRFFLGTSTKTVTKRVESNDPLLISLSELVSAADTKLKTIESIIRRVREVTKCNSAKEDIYRERLHRIADLYDRDALCEVFPEKTEDDAFELFSRLNKGGMSLSSGDVEGARLASTATKNIVAPMRAVAVESDMRALGVNFIFLLRCLVTVHRGNCSFSKLPRNWADNPKEIAASWFLAEESVRKTTELVRKRLGWANRRWLPSTMALVPIAYMISQYGDTKLSEYDEENLIKYLLISGLRGIFRGTTETTVNSYVNSIRKAKANHSSLSHSLLLKIPKNQQYKIRADEIRNSAAMYSPLMQIYLAMLVRTGARSWPSGKLLSALATNPLPKDPIVVHHIFPRELLQRLDVPTGKVNTMANFAIVSQSDNLELADRDPFEVWRNSSSDQRECAAEQLCVTVAKEDLLKDNAFEDFFDHRAAQLANKLNEFLGF